MPSHYSPLKLQLACVSFCRPRSGPQTPPSRRVPQPSPRRAHGDWCHRQRVSTAAGNAHIMAAGSLQTGASAETAPLAAWWLGRASSPAAVREACTHGSHGGPTAGLADGFVQANLVIVPAEHAEHFREFCRLNPRPCPLLEELPPGERHTCTLANGADLATCLPRYRVWRHGRAAEEVSDLRGLCTTSSPCLSPSP